MLVEIPDKLLAKAITMLNKGGYLDDQEEIWELLRHLGEQRERVLDQRNRRSDSTVVVTVSDPITGETLESQEVTDDYSLVTAGSCWCSYAQLYQRTGTVQLTIKGRR